MPTTVSGGFVGNCGGSAKQTRWVGGMWPSEPGRYSHTSGSAVWCRGNGYVTRTARPVYSPRRYTARGSVLQWTVTGSRGGSDVFAVATAFAASRSKNWLMVNATPAATAKATTTGSFFLMASYSIPSVPFTLVTTDELPPGPAEPCAENVTVVLGKRCVNGVWVKDWIPTPELVDDDFAARRGGGCGGGKAAVVKAAVEQRWNLHDIKALIESLKGL